MIFVPLKIDTGILGLELNKMKGEKWYMLNR